MTALWFRVGRWLRAQARSTVLLTLVVALVATVVLAIAAGARRTSTAPDRYTATRNDALDLTGTQEEGQPLTPEIARLPGVGVVAAATFVFGAMTRPGAADPLGCVVFAGSVVPTGARVVSGREADPHQPGEFVISRDFAIANGLSIGDTVRLTTMTPADAAQYGFDFAHLTGLSFEGVLVGLIDSPANLDDPSAVAVFSPALLADPGIGISATVLAIGLRDGVSLSDLRSQMDTLPGGQLVSLQPAEVVSATIRTAVRAQGIGLWILAGLSALAAVVALGQVLARQVRLAPDETASLSALGYSRAQLLGESAARAGAVAVLGVALAVGAAVAVSGRFPFGFVRRIEPHPGLRADAVTLSLGALVLVLGLTGWVVMATRPRRPHPLDRRPSAIAALASRCPSPAMGTGLRFAFTPSGRDAGSPTAGIAGMALLVAGLAGTLTFAASLRRLVDEPPRYGVNFAFMVDNGADAVSPKLLDVLRSDPDVAGVTLYTSTQARVGSSTIAVAGMDSVRGVLVPVVLSGRLPVHPDEVALGRVSARELGLSVGDELPLTNDAGTITLRITGLIIPPGIGGNDVVGHGAVLTHDGFVLLDPTSPANAAALELRADAPPGAVERIAAAAEVPSYDPTPTRPPAIRNVARITFVPFVLAGLLAALAMLTLANLVYAGLIRRDRQIAVLRALGAGRRWLIRAERWHAILLTLVPAVIGLPAGFIAGRYAFRLFADRIGTVDGAAVPLGLVAIPLGLLVVLGLGAATVAGRRARRIPPAVLLRAG